MHKAAALGLTSYMLPEAYGGGGIDSLVTDCLILEELSWGDGGLGALVTSGGFFAAPILELGSEEQKQRFLSPLCGERPPLTALATTEPDYGSDAAGMTTLATRVDGGYRLRGQKTWVSNGGIAEHYIVFAQTEPGSRSRGITAFVIGLGDEGVAFGEPMRKLGDRGIVNSELFLDDAFVPDANRIGEEGQGFVGLMRTFDKSRVVLAAGCVGIARAAYEYAAQYARERVQFGKPIVEHQAVGFRLADVAMRIDAARLLTWRAAEAFDAARPSRRTRRWPSSTPPRRACSRPGPRCRRSAAGATRASTRWRSGSATRSCEEIWEGSSDIQRLIISRAIAKGEL